jgi:hypothetical protein
VPRRAEHLRAVQRLRRRSRTREIFVARFAAVAQLRCSQDPRLVRSFPRSTGARLVLHPDRSVEFVPASGEEGSP